MSVPLLLFAFPIVASVAAYLLRRRQIASVMTGAGTAMILTIIIVSTNVDTQVTSSVETPLLNSSWVLLERSLTMASLSRNALVILYSGVGVLFLLSLVLKQDNLFVPLVLLALAPLAGILTAGSISTGTLFLVVGMVIVAILIQGKRAGSTLTSLRYLTLTVLVFPLLLTIGWMSETRPAQFLTWMPFLLLAVSLILLYSFPFQLWVSPAVSESKSLVPVVVFGLVQLVLVIFLVGLFVENPSIYRNARLLQLLRLSGMATLILAAALILIAPSISRLIGYLLIIDLGATAIALGLGGKIGLELVIDLVLIRTVSLLMVGFGLGMIRRQLKSTTGIMHQAFSVESLARRSPIGLTLTIYGGLSLAGMPLTPGFAGRWAVLEMASNQYQWVAIIIVMAVISAGIGMARMMLPNPKIQQAIDTSFKDESRVLRIIGIILLASGVLISLIFPLVLSLSQNLIKVL